MRADDDRCASAPTRAPRPFPARAGAVGTGATTGREVTGPAAGGGASTRWINAIDTSSPPADAESASHAGNRASTASSPIRCTWSRRSVPAWMRQLASANEFA
jgi:hypothetical protein